MGMARDMAQRKTLARTNDVKHRTRVRAARKSIYEKDYAIDSRAVEDLLQEHSLVPTAVFFILFLKIFVLIRYYQNAFSSKLAPFGFNMFSTLVVDLMHEVELGVWKAIFIHLLRILDCQNKGLTHELDRRQV